MTRAFPALAIYRLGRHFPALDGGALAASAQAYDPALHEAPLVVGHPAGDAPARGWVASLEFDEGSGLLRAEPRQVAAELREQVAAGMYKKISASFYRPEASCNPVPGVWYLRHVGFLGAQPPAVKGLPAVVFAEGEREGDYETVEFSEGGARPWIFRAIASLFRRQRERLIETADMETADRVLPVWEVEGLAAEAERLEEPEAAPPAFAESGQDGSQGGDMAGERTGGELDQARADLDTRATAVAERERAVAAQEVERARREAEAFAEKLAAEGRILPRDQAAVAELLFRQGAEEAVEFAEPEGGGGAKGTAGGFLRRFLSGLPVQVDFSERAAGVEDEAVGGSSIRLPAGWSADPERIGLHERAVAFAEKHDVDYEAAVTAVAREG